MTPWLYLGGVPNVETDALNGLSCVVCTLTLQTSSPTEAKAIPISWRDVAQRD